MAYRVIGTSPARADAWEKVRGRPIYAGDLALSGTLHGRIVRSPYPSARIVRLDTRAAADVVNDEVVLCLLRPEIRDKSDVIHAAA